MDFSEILPGDYIEAVFTRPQTASVFMREWKNAVVMYADLWMTFQLWG